MPKKPGKGKAKGLARARTRPAGKKAKGRPFQAKGINPPKSAELEEGTFTLKGTTWVKEHSAPPFPSRSPRSPDPPRFTPARTEKSLLKTSERLAGYASVLAAGMLSNPELINDLHDQDSIASIIETAIFMATQINQRV